MSSIFNNLYDTSEKPMDYEGKKSGEMFQYLGFSEVLDHSDNSLQSRHRKNLYALHDTSVFPRYVVVERATTVKTEHAI